MRFRFIAAAVYLIAALALPFMAARAASVTTPDGPIPQTGATPGMIITTASNNCSNIKATAGILFKLSAAPSTFSTANFVRLYDTASTPAATSNIPVAIIQLPLGGTPLPNSVADVGEAFTSGIAICVTGTATATSNTAASSGSVINYSYK